ncbi:hypothetical protein [Streptomyces sp. TR06-5]|uniref:hypothetical protein n=1 Tax=unclassified Streptomyces TaxID=2593676 RepID=UPI0039A2BF0E
MESGPAVFAGTALTVFGVALLLWTSTRARLRQPVAEGVHPVAAIALAAAFGVVSLALGALMLLPG